MVIGAQSVVLSVAAQSLVLSVAVTVENSENLSLLIDEIICVCVRVCVWLSLSLHCYALTAQLNTI